MTSFGAPERIGPRAVAARTAVGSNAAQRCSLGQASSQNFSQYEQESRGPLVYPTVFVRFLTTGCWSPSQVSVSLEQAATHNPHPAHVSSDQTSASSLFDMTSSRVAI
jgi:hypothetical protein